MQVGSTDIKKFQVLYKKHFNQVLSDDDARKKLLLLVKQMSLVYRPITKEQVKRLANRDAR